MSDKEIKALLADYVSEVGKPTAHRELIIEGVSPSMAERLTSGRYDNETGLLMRGAIKRVVDAGRAKAG